MDCFSTNFFFLKEEGFLDPLKNLISEKEFEDFANLCKVPDNLWKNLRNTKENPLLKTDSQPFSSVFLWIYIKKTKVFSVFNQQREKNVIWKHRFRTIFLEFPAFIGKNFQGFSI